MKQTFSLLILLILSLGAQAQTLRESVRGKYGEYQGSSETRICGGKATTTMVYKDKYGQYAGSSTYRHSGNGGTATYRDKYGQVTRTGKVKGRIPAKSSTYFYGKNSSRSRNK